MKKITMYLTLMLALPVLLQAQYSGGNGRGDVSVSLTNINIFVREIASELPTKYDLKQNYPNPFNQSSIINFQCAIKSNVTMKVFDALGSEVAILVNEVLQPGTYQVRFDAPSTLPSGVYFYKISAGDTEGSGQVFIETRKMLMIK